MNLDIFRLIKIKLVNVLKENAINQEYTGINKNQNY